MTVPKRYPWQRKLAQALDGPAMFVLAAVGRRAGKTHMASDLGGRTALRTRMEVPWVAPTYQIGKKGLEKFEELWSSVLAQPLKRSPPAEAHLLGGGRMSWVSGDRPPLGILGGGYPLLILDEAARINRELLHQEILPTIADTGGKILAVTTPRGRRNWIHEWASKARDGHPLYSMVHGPSTLNPNPNIQRFVDLCRSEMDETLFRQEILAEFVEGEGSVFRRILEAAVLERFLDKPAPRRQYVVGCDVAKHQDWTVLYAMDVDNGQVRGWDRFQDLSWPVIEGRIATFSKRWRNAEVWIDSTGVGDSTYDHLEAAGVPVVPTTFTSESKAHLVQGLSVAMDSEEVKFPNDDTLVAELEAFEYEQLPSGRFRYGAPEGQHDDCVIALALAVFARNQRLTGVPV